MPSLKDIVDAMSASWPAALAICLASLALLGSDAYGIKYVSSLPSWSTGAAFLAALASGSILCVAVIRAGFDLLTLPFRRRRVRKAIEADLETLRNLPPDEISLLAWAAVHKKQVISGPYFDPRIKALLTKGLLFTPGGSHRSDQTPFYIPDHIWKELQREVDAIPAGVRAEIEAAELFPRGYF